MLNNHISKFGHSKQEQNLMLVTDESTTLTVNQRVVHVAGFTGAVTITLPPVSACSGLIFSIRILNTAAVNNVTIADQDDSYNWSDVVAAGASGNYALLYCDGVQWFVLDSVIA